MKKQFLAFSILLAVGVAFAAQIPFQTTLDYMTSPTTLVKLLSGIYDIDFSDTDPTHYGFNLFESPENEIIAHARDTKIITEMENNVGATFIGLSKKLNQQIEVLPFRDQLKSYLLEKNNLRDLSVKIAPVICTALRTSLQADVNENIKESPEDLDGKESDMLAKGKAVTVAAIDSTINSFMTINDEILFKVHMAALENKNNIDDKATKAWASWNKLYESVSSGEYKSLRKIADIGIASNFTFPAAANNLGQDRKDAIQGLIDFAKMKVDLAKSVESPLTESQRLNILKKSQYMSEDSSSLLNSISLNFYERRCLDAEILKSEKSCQQIMDDWTFALIQLKTNISNDCVKK